MTVFKIGDQIKGKRTSHHSGKTGVVVNIPRKPTSGWIEVKWDGGKRKSVIQQIFIELEDSNAG